MVGESGCSVNQWLAAAQRPPHLTCALIYNAFTDLYRDAVYHGGVFSMGFWNFWTTDNLRASTTIGAGDRGPFKRIDADLLGMVLEHPVDGAFWRERSPDVTNIEVPTLVVAWWYNVGLHLRGSLKGYEQLTGPKRLLRSREPTVDGRHHRDRARHPATAARRAHLHHRPTRARRRGDRADRPGPLRLIRPDRHRVLRQGLRAAGRAQAQGTRHGARRQERPATSRSGPPPTSSRKATESGSSSPTATRWSATASSITITATRPAATASTTTRNIPRTSSSRSYPNRDRVAATPRPSGRRSPWLGDDWSPNCQRRSRPIRPVRARSVMTSEGSAAGLSPEAMREAIATLSSPDRVESPFGTLEFFDGVPTAGDGDHDL